MLALLTSVASCHQAASLPPYLLFHLAKTHNAWHQALHLLRVQQIRLESRESKDATLDMLKDSQAALLLILCEHDSWVGFQRFRFKNLGAADTVKAITHEQLVLDLSYLFSPNLIVSG